MFLFHHKDQISPSDICDIHLPACLAASSSGSCRDPIIAAKNTLARWTTPFILTADEEHIHPLTLIRIEGLVKLGSELPFFHIKKGPREAAFVRVAVELL